jgi:hypothetical protein
MTPESVANAGFAPETEFEAEADDSPASDAHTVQGGE